MTDREFLELFNKIDDKFLDEARRDHGKRRIDKRRLFNTLYTMAACAAMVIAAALLVSSFIGNYQFANPGSADQTSSDSAMTSETPSDDNSQADNTSPLKLSVLYSRLSFPENGVEMDKDDGYYMFTLDEREWRHIPAELSFSVGFSDSEEKTPIPARMYFFNNCYSDQFYYADSLLTTTSRDFIVKPNTDCTIKFAFDAYGETSTVAVVCVFFPGDAARQTCLIVTAGNETVPDDFIDLSGIGELIPIEPFENVRRFVTVTDTPFKWYVDFNFLDEYDDLEKFGYPDEDVSDALEIFEKNVLGEKDGETVVIPNDSVYINAYFNESEGTGNWQYHSYYLIALIDGAPAPIFDGRSYCAVNDIYGERVFQYKVPQEYLPENSSIQIIALPSQVVSWECYGIASDCCLLSGGI